MGLNNGAGFQPCFFPAFPGALPQAGIGWAFGPRALRLLLKQAEANPSQVQIDKTVIDPERISSVEHSKLAGLQVADAVASGFHFALKVNRYGETETSYLPHLKKTVYRHKAVALGYGLKLWPEDFATVKAKAPEAFNLEGL